MRRLKCSLQRKRSNLIDVGRGTVVASILVGQTDGLHFQRPLQHEGKSGKFPVIKAQQHRFAPRAGSNERCLKGRLQMSDLPLQRRTIYTSYTDSYGTYMI